ncbi:MAG TPA: hypothetical protein VKW76_06830 [Candidatus Binatia bacterium]|nr:hypothetical protein [Candidatus Binatia bacterium]
MTARPPWLDPTLSDLAVGRLLAHLDELASTAIDSRWLVGAATTIFRTMLQALAQDRDVDAALADAGLLGIAEACAAFWQEHPLSRRELECALRDGWERRMLDMVGRTMTLLAWEPSPYLAAAMFELRPVDSEQRQDVLATLGRLERAWGG